MHIRTVRRASDISTELLLGKKTAVALGAFDGIHKGHKRLIENIVSKGELTPCVFAFFKSKSHEITDNNERTELFMKLGVEFCFFQYFDEEFKNLSPEDFVIQYIKEALNAKNVTVGENYRFGKGGAGDAFLLQKLCGEHGIKTDIIPMLCDDDGALSSTRVREYLMSGKVSKAAEILGRSYSVIGKVVSGMGRGEKLGFPTANIKPDKKTVLLKPAVYATAVWVDEKRYAAITNYGAKPTFQETDVLFETYIPEFDGDLYGREIKIEFLEYLREIKKFENAELLKKQLKTDCENALKIYC